MSRDLNIEDGIGTQFSGEHGNQTVAGEFQREQSSLRNSVTDILERRSPGGQWFFLIVCAISLIADAVFFYIPAINDGKKCIALDIDGWIYQAIVARSVADFLYIILSICQLHSRLHIDLPREYLKIFRRIICFGFAIDLVIILPIPQGLLMFAINKRMTSKNFMFAFDYFFIAQYMLRIIRMLPLTRSLNVRGNLQAMFAGILSFIFACGQSSHVIGAVWYFFAIKREMDCWKTACRNHKGCGHAAFYCDERSAKYPFLNEFCPSKTPDSTLSDFGIFGVASQSGIMEITTNGFQRNLYGFRWGLQNLSSFGQGLETSINIWENIFAVVITIMGVLLLGFAIGLFQEGFKYSWEGILETALMKQEISQWSPFRKLPYHLKEEIMKEESHSRKLKNINVEVLLSGLEESLTKEIKRKFCWDMLKKIQEFESGSDSMLGNLCDCMKPVFYTERTRIFREGDPIDKMIFVLQGELWTFSSRGMGTDHHSIGKDYLEAGGFFGEELVSWAKDDSSSSNLPSTTTNVQALTNVEAFVLVADDLKKIFRKHKQELVFTEASRV